MRLVKSRAMDVAPSQGAQVEMSKQFLEHSLDETLVSFKPRVTAFISQITWEAHEVDDLTQETLIRVSRGWNGFRGDSALASWIFQIASNVVKDYFRSKSVRPQPASEDKDIRSPDSHGILGQLESKETGECVRNEIHILPWSYKRILIFHYMEGKGVKEIAASENISENSVKVRLHRARERFRNSCVSSCDVSPDENGNLYCGRRTVDSEDGEGCIVGDNTF
ncbi:MAG: sigma-70 family RNA polymerase sigma factor [Nitrospinota bacterium]|nr:sigma-70 family RNA polymerase sigma factor [Nitrospinota bacterium]